MTDKPAHRQDKRVDAFIEAASSLPGGKEAAGLFDVGAEAITDFTSWWVDRYARGTAHVDGDGNGYVGFILDWPGLQKMLSSVDPRNESQVSDFLTSSTITNTVNKYGRLKGKPLALAIVEKESQGIAPPRFYLELAAAMLHGLGAAATLDRYGLAMVGEQGKAGFPAHYDLSRESSDWSTIVGIVGGPVAKASRLYMLLSNAKPVVLGALKPGSSY